GGDATRAGRRVETLVGRERLEVGAASAKRVDFSADRRQRHRTARARERRKRAPGVYGRIVFERAGNCILVLGAEEAADEVDLSVSGGRGHVGGAARQGLSRPPRSRLGGGVLLSRPSVC